MAPSRVCVATLGASAGMAVGPLGRPGDRGGQVLREHRREQRHRQRGRRGERGQVSQGWEDGRLGRAEVSSAAGGGGGRRPGRGAGGRGHAWVRMSSGGGPRKLGSSANLMTVCFGSMEVEIKLVTCVRMRLTCGAECPGHRGSSAPTQRVRCRRDRASRGRRSKQCAPRRTPEHVPCVVDRAPESDCFASAITFGILGRFPSTASAPTVPSPEPSLPRPAPSRPVPSRSPPPAAARPPGPGPLFPGPLAGPPVGPLWPPQLSPRPIPFPWQVALFPRPGYCFRERISRAVSIGKNQDSRAPARFDLAGLGHLAMHPQNAFHL